MSERKKSAKDIAFEKERCQYKKKIRELDQCLAKRKAEAENLKQRVDALESENARLQDWVDRLLEYTELSKEDFMAMVESDKNIAKVVQLGEKMMNISKFWM
jgi:predicted nuclease with TOPRIM domain